MVLPVPEPAHPPGGPLPETNFAVVDVTVFDGEAFRPHRDVWVEDGRIRAVGQRLTLPDGLPRVDGRGHTLLPGLIDAHTHTFGLVLTDALRFGVTTVFDQFHIAIHARAKARGPRGPFPRQRRGPLLRGQRGDGSRRPRNPVRGAGGDADHTRGGAGVRQGTERGRLRLDQDHLGRTGAPSARTSRRSTGRRSPRSSRLPTPRSCSRSFHVSTLEHGLASLEMGIDGLVHVWGDEVISEEDAARFAEAGVFVIPTLSVRVAAAGESMGPELLAATRPEDVSDMQRQTLAQTFPRRVGTSEASIESVRRLHAAGVRILAGTDAPNPGTGFGISMHGELRLLERAGLGAAEALAAATGVAADAFGVEDRGRLARGRIADLLLVAGDLEGDLSRSTAIAGVWKDGFPVEAAWAAPRQPE